MMIDIENLWENMGGNNKRLFHTETSKEIYISTISGNYAFSIFLKTANFKLNPKLKLSGLVFKKHQNEIHLILSNNSNWELFLLIGVDVINSIDRSFPTDNDLIQHLEYRIHEWQQILKNLPSIEIPFIIQMGLFSELMMIVESFNEGYALEAVINCWSGPHKGKQDFNFENFLIEVKSHITEKDPFISISSEHQLYSIQKPIFLVSYSLTRNNTGESIRSLADFILARLNNLRAKNIFIRKLYEYGFRYYENYLDLYLFKIDSKSYYKVSNEFPKITPEVLIDGVQKVNYKIDLSKCSSFLELKLPQYYDNN